MSALVIAFIVALSGSVWSYTKLQNHTGYGNTKTTLAGATVIFVILFVLTFTLAHMLLNQQN